MPKGKYVHSPKAGDLILLAGGKTGRDGSVQAPGWATFKMSRPYYYTNPEIFVIVYKQGDAAVISNKWGTGIYPYSFGIPYQWYPVYPEYAAHIYTDRGIYRSGDTIHIKGLFRKKKQGQWIISNLKEVEMVINNSRDENIFKGLLPVNNYGSFTYDLKLKSSAPTGNYSIKISPPSKEKSKSGVAREKNKLKVSYQNQLKASGSFRVEAYRPAKFEVLVKGDKESYIVDDNFQGIISASYLSGGPLAKAEVSWSLRLNTSYFINSISPSRYTPLCSLTGRQLSCTKPASNHSASSFGLPIVADNPKSCTFGRIFLNKVIRISNVGPRLGSLSR